MFDHIAHISEKDFESVCREVVANSSLQYLPADWEWTAYPDIGYATLHDGHYTSLPWGCHNYSHGISEDILIKSTPQNAYGETYVVDTKDELRQLIKETFNV